MLLQPAQRLVQHHQVVAAVLGGGEVVGEVEAVPGR
jgi:hypothetical protein